MTKKCLKMMFFHIKNQKFAGACRWVSYIPKCALNYDWLHGKGLILRTLENSSQGDAKNWKSGKIGEKKKKLMFWGGFEPSLPVTLNIEVTRSAYWAIEADDKWEKKFWKSFHISFVSNQFIWPSSNEFCNCV